VSALRLAPQVLALRRDAERVLRQGRQPEEVLSDVVRAAFRDVPDVLVMRNEVILPRILAVVPERYHEAIFRAVAQDTRWGLAKGAPDLPFVAGGTWLGVELKSAGGSLNEDQRRWHAMAADRGVRNVVVRAKEDTWEGILGAVDAIEAAVEEVRRGGR
jgi:hypothetical protein